MPEENTRIFKLLNGDVIINRTAYLRLHRAIRIDYVSCLGKMDYERGSAVITVEEIANLDEFLSGLSGREYRAVRNNFKPIKRCWTAYNGKGWRKTLARLLDWNFNN